MGIQFVMLFEVEICSSYIFWFCEAKEFIDCEWMFGIENVIDKQVNSVQKPLSLEAVEDIVDFHKFKRFSWESWETCFIAHYSLKIDLIRKNIFKEY